MARALLGCSRLGCEKIVDKGQSFDVRLLYVELLMELNKCSVCFDFSFLHDCLLFVIFFKIDRRANL